MRAAAGARGVFLHQARAALAPTWFTPCAHLLRSRTGLRFCSMDEQVCFDEGACMLYVDSACPLRDFPPEQWGAQPPDVLLSDTRILDVLLHNSDRHAGEAA